MPPTRTIFVAWDSELSQVAASFAGLQELPPAGVQIEILGEAGSVALGQLDRRLKECTAKSSDLLAVVDTPNANMAWEMGMALARGLGLALATEGPQPEGKWTRGTPLENLLYQPGIADPDVFERLLEEVWPRIGKRPTRGTRRLALIPAKGTGKMWLRALRAPLEKDGWTILDVQGWTLAELPRLLAEADRLAWVQLPLAKGEARHGVANSIGALAAGYASALGMRLGVFSCPGCPKVADAAYSSLEGGHSRIEFDATYKDLLARLR